MAGMSLDSTGSVPTSIVTTRCPVLSVRQHRRDAPSRRNAKVKFFLTGAPGLPDARF